MRVVKWGPYSTLNMHGMLTLASVCLAALAVEAHSAAPTLQVRAYALAAAARTRCAACVRMVTKSGGALK